MNKANFRWCAIVIAMMAYVNVVHNVEKAHAVMQVWAETSQGNMWPYDYNRVGQLIIRGVAYNAGGYNETGHDAYYYVVFEHFRGFSRSAPSVYKGLAWCQDTAIYPGEYGYGYWIEFASWNEVNAAPRTCSGTSYYQSHVDAFAHNYWAGYAQLQHIVANNQYQCFRHKCLGHAGTCLAPCTGCSEVGMLCQGTTSFPNFCCNCW